MERGPKREPDLAPPITYDPRDRGGRLRIRPPVTTIAVLCALASCDRLGEITIVPEFDLRYSFESGLEEWLPAGADLTEPAVTWEIGRSAELASVGSHSARIRLDNTNGRAKVWLVRRFDVQPERAYDVEISFDFASADAQADGSWRIVAGAHTRAPAQAAELVVQDATTHGSAAGAGHVWSERRYVARATADREGRLYVVLGLWGTEPAARVYYMDEVRLLFTRVSAGG